MRPALPQQNEEIARVHRRRHTRTFGRDAQLGLCRRVTHWARGSIVDTRKEEQAQQILFGIAVYAGIFGSVLPILIGRIVRLSRRLARTRTRLSNDRNAAPAERLRR